MKTVSLLACLATLLAACGNLRTEISPSELPGEPEKLVVYGYLSPQDTVLSVKVGRSKPVLGDGAEAVPFNITNATVSLSNGSQSVKLIHNLSDQIYKVKASALPIVAGKTYTLTVSTPDGKQVSAQATIPKPIPIQTIRLDSSVLQYATEWQKLYLMTFSWQDPPGEENFYKYGGTFDWNAAGYPINGQSPAGFTLRSINFQRQSTTGNLLSDNKQDGTVLSSLSSDAIASVAVKASVSNPQEQLASIRLAKVYPGARITAQLLHTEKIYYQYASAVLNQRRNRDNPFAEPVLIPSNIQGGLGCFAGYNRTERVLLVR